MGFGKYDEDKHHRRGNVDGKERRIVKFIMT
jgi:hypothetical protein